MLVLPSRHEGLGRVVIEAFARGRGVVASRAGGILDLVDDGVQGLLVDPEDDGRARRRARAVLSDRDARRAARRPPPRPASPSGTRRPRSSPSACGRSWTRLYTGSAMRAEELKQLLKNGVYRSLGEAATGVGAVDGGDERTLACSCTTRSTTSPATR